MSTYPRHFPNSQLNGFEGAISYEPNVSFGQRSPTAHHQLPSTTFEQQHYQPRRMSTPFSSGRFTGPEGRRLVRNASLSQYGSKRG